MCGTLYTYSASLWTMMEHGMRSTYVREQMGKHPSNHFFNEWDADALQKIISDHKAIVKYHKYEGHKKSHPILVVVDDFADRPEVMHQSGGAGILNMLYTHGRHYMISTIVCSQNLTLISTTIREYEEHQR